MVIFLDLHIYIPSFFASSNIYDRCDNIEFDMHVNVANFSYFGGNVPVVPVKEC